MRTYHMNNISCDTECFDAVRIVAINVVLSAPAVRKYHSTVALSTTLQ